MAQDFLSRRMAYDKSQDMARIKLTPAVAKKLDPALDTVSEIWESQLLKRLRATPSLQPLLDAETSDLDVFLIASCNPQLLGMKVGMLCIKFFRAIFMFNSFSVFHFDSCKQVAGWLPSYACAT